MCDDYQLRHSGVVLRIEMVLLKSHRMKMATDGHLAKTMLGGHRWCPGNIQLSHWKEGQTGLTVDENRGPQVGMGRGRDADPSQEECLGVPGRRSSVA